MFGYFKWTRIGVKFELVLQNQNGLKEMLNLDLKELSQRESERVEWKENVADIESVIKTAVALANDFSNLGGGYIICGAKEEQDEHGFQKLVQIGLLSSRLKEIEGKVLSDLREKVDPPIVPLTDEIVVNDERRILVFLIAATGNAHCYRANAKDSSTYYVRIGRETREAKNGILRELLVKKNQLLPWDKRINNAADIKDIDLLALREYLQEMNLWDPKKSLEDYLSDTEQLSSFIPPLAAKESLQTTIHPRNFTLLMFAQDPIKFFNGAYVVFSIYNGTDRSEPTSERHQIVGNLVQQARRCIELLNAESYTTFDKTDDIPNQLKYPTRALQEAVVNCLAHRDYEIDQPSRITVFSDRIEIYSPGSLPRAVDKKKFMVGKASPYWRNQSLAYFFNKLQLAQAEGQGIPTILRTMKEEGCPDPTFDIEEESLICVLPAHPRHLSLKVLHEIESDIILGKHQQSLEKLKGLLGKDPYNFRAISLLCEVSNLMNAPSNVIDFILDNNIQLDKLNADTLILLAETLSLIKNNQQAAGVVDRIMRHATLLSLGERQIEKAVISLKKLGRNEEVVDFINKSMQSNPALNRNSLLLENRARAKMDLAKTCMDTARDRRHNAQRKEKAWNKAQALLAEAERDINNALENTTSPMERDYITRDMDFLFRMKSSPNPNKRFRRN